MWILSFLIHANFAQAKSSKLYTTGCINSPAGVTCKVPCASNKISPENSPNFSLASWRERYCKISNSDIAGILLTPLPPRTCNANVRKASRYIKTSLSFAYVCVSRILRLLGECGAAPSHFGIDFKGIKATSLFCLSISRIFSAHFQRARQGFTKVLPHFLCRNLPPRAILLIRGGVFIASRIRTSFSCPSSTHATINWTSGAILPISLTATRLSIYYTQSIESSACILWWLINSLWSISMEFYRKGFLGIKFKAFVLLILSHPGSRRIM